MNNGKTAAKPELSVAVVILTGGKGELRRCLTSLTRQRRAPVTEIVVPCDQSALHLLELNREFPSVRFLTIDRERLTCAELRTVGVRESQGRIVAITEDHCIATPDWCAQIVKAHEAPHVAVGGAVEKGVPDTPINWSLYLADYLRYMKPIPAGPAQNLTDCNVTYKRAALDAIAVDWREEFHEPVVHGALRAKGGSLWLEPQIMIHQQRNVRLGAAIHERYAYGRLFASTRFVKLDPAQRLLYSLLALTLPVVLIGRVAAHIFRKRRYVAEFVRAVPYLILLCTVWAGGEFLGYLTGRAEKTLSPSQRTRAVQSQRGQAAVT